MKQKEQHFSLEGVHCAGCVNTITKAVLKLDNIEDISVNLINKTAVVTGSATEKDIIQAVIDAGYNAKPAESLSQTRQKQEKAEKAEYKHKLLQSSIFLIFGFSMLGYALLGGSMEINSLNSQIAWSIVGFACLFVMFFFAKETYTNSFKLAKKLNSNMDTLIALGTLVAWIYSMFVVIFPSFFPEQSRHVYFEASLIILGMVSLGQALDLKTRGKTSKAIYRLLDLRNKTAQVIRDGKDITVDLDEVQVADLIRVNSGENIPVDGVVIEGVGQIDESMLTGESISIQKNKNDAVFAGTVNIGQSFVMKATKVGNETKLAQITKLVASAQNSKPPIGLLADKIVGVFVPIMLLISITTAIIWFFTGASANHILIAAVSVIIIACPCALGLATPISTIIGMGKSAEYGGLIRNGESLQKASKIDVVVLDKTGTLTQGKPSVIDSKIIDDKSKEKVYNYVYSLEKSSSHPLAKSLTNFTENLQTNSFKLEGVEEVHGKGIKAEYKNDKMLLGSFDLMQENNIAIEDKDLQNQISTWRESAYSAVFFAINDKLEAVFAIADKIREDTKSALSTLNNMGIETIMLTGDNQQTAKAVASTLGIEKWQAACLPEDKLNYVKKLQSQGKFVAVAGDGVNDSPALAISDVGFAIGGGTDVAIESSDVALLNPSLHGISNIINISQSTIRNIKQNLFGAFIYNLIGIPIAAGILYPFTGFMLSPIIASSAMALSSVTVVSNANRLRFLRLSSK